MLPSLRQVPPSTPFDSVIPPAYSASKGMTRHLPLIAAWSRELKTTGRMHAAHYHWVFGAFRPAGFDSWLGEFLGNV